MGCCISRPDGPNSPYPGGVNGSDRAFNDPSGGAAASRRGTARSGGGQPGVDGGGRGMGQSARAIVGDRAGDSTASGSSTASSPSTIGRRRQQAAAAPPIPSSVSRLPPPQAPLAAHINKPIRRRRWTSRNRVWTRRSIDRERTDFFDTRVTGRSEIWQTLRTTLEILWEADLVEAARQADSGRNGRAQQSLSSPVPVSSQSSPNAAAGPGSPTASSSAEVAEAHATAQTILDAADITLPTGDMAQGAYDAFGNFYPMSAWIVSDPTNLDNDPEHDLDDETKRALVDEGEAALSSASEADDESDDETEGENDSEDDDTADAQARNNRIRSRREKKGKAVLPADVDQISVRARLSTISKDVTVRIGREDTVYSLAHRITEAAKLPVKTRIRIAYMGKILKEGTSLVAQGWKEGHIVNALIFDTP
ncbi:ubiquitin domain-containing protein [Ophiostoma piceae UAMH 11346]|uniref:Ubiquitin domain-containing protein n=1 Tax=Ophiostoma piceae (strain UAMH 11346) TaxID=1262450 RepID=S3CAN2_OPHP1|nr:ubiquitin domain-containing protein [Ophiostoma piceae UAMH 11346]